MCCPSTLRPAFATLCPAFATLCPTFATLCAAFATLCPAFPLTWKTVRRKHRFQRRFWNPEPKLNLFKPTKVLLDAFENIDDSANCAQPAETLYLGI